MAPVLALTIALASHPLLDKPAPGFVLPRMTQGEVDSQSLRGAPAVYVFGSTELAAPACRDWMVALHQNFEKLGKKPGEVPRVFQIAVLDNPWFVPHFAVKARLKDFVPDYGYDLVLLEWKTAVGDAYGIVKDEQPRVFVLDKKGVVRYHHTGKMTDELLLSVLELVGKL